MADIGYGQGHSSVAIARAYPKVLVDGIDLDEASIADAEKVSEEAGVADRVTFSVDDAAAVQVGDRRVCAARRLAEGVVRFGVRPRRQAP